MENVSCSDSSFCEFMYFKQTGRGCNFVGYCSFQRPLVPYKERFSNANPEAKITVSDDAGKFIDEDIDEQTNEIIRSYKIYQEAIKENGASIIPPLTTELTETWKQPHRKDIHFINDVAYMDNITFENLNNYSSFDPKPKGMYAGKIWRRWVEEDSSWYLCWYVQDGEETIASRPIEVTK
jgi:hypothetical protein